MATSQHRKFDLGIIQDESSSILPEGAFADGTNLLFDKLGIVRKRGGITGVGATTTYSSDNLGVLVADDSTERFYGFARGGGNLSYINQSTGAMTTIGGGALGGDYNNDGGRPFQHHGFLMWPCYTQNTASGTVGTVMNADTNGAVAARTFTTPASVVMTAGDKVIPCAVADSPTTLMQVGQIITIVYAAGTQAYIGRVTRLISTTAFEVYPTPTAAGTGSTVKTYNSHFPSLTNFAGANAYIGGKVGMSFQGRIMLGFCNRYDHAGAARQEQFPRRVYFSSTLLEGDATGNNQFQGAVWGSINAFPDANYFDIPDATGVSAMSPTGFGDAIIFSTQKAYRLTGNLSTQYGTEQSITWAVREIPNSVGCMSERSLQRTPHGVVFAHDSGVYTTDGNDMLPLMHERIANRWKSLVDGANFKIYGSALVYGNHYYMCGISAGTRWGLLVNLDTLAWSILAGKQATAASWIINSACVGPLDPSTTWALKYYDISGGAVSMTGGQLVNLESMFNPTSSTKSDNDGTVVAWKIETPYWTEESPTVNKYWEAATIEYGMTGGTDVYVRTSQAFRSDEVSFWGGVIRYLPPQDRYTITAMTGLGVAPIVITVGAGHNIKIDTFVWVRNAAGNTNANGRWYVQAVTATTVTLAGTYGGPANWSNQGYIEQVQSRDIRIATSTMSGDQAGIGPGARYTIYDNIGCDYFELYGIIHTYEEADPHTQA